MDDEEVKVDYMAVPAGAPDWPGSADALAKMGAAINAFACAYKAATGVLPLWINMHTEVGPVRLSFGAEADHPLSAPDE